MQWCRHELAEKVCESLGLSVEYREVAASDIDVEKSRMNRARPVSIMEDVVEDYARAMQAGDVFPSIVLARLSGTARYVIAGGNHRHEAAIRCGVAVFPSIVVPCQVTEFDVLSKALNAIEGQRPDRAARVKQAIGLIEQHNVDVAEACLAMRVSEASVRDAMRANAVKTAASKVGIIIPNTVSTTVLEKAHQHMESTPVFAAVADLLANRRITTSEMADLNAQLRKARSEPAKLACVAEKAAAIAAHAGTRKRAVTMRVRQQILTAVKIFEHFLEECTCVNQLQMDKQEFRQTLLRIERIRNKLRSIRIDG